jgi:dTMP kinase
MSARGKLLAVEGIDGAGKQTQVEMLAEALRRLHARYLQLSFPRYQSFFGRAVASYLAGEFGPLSQVNPHFSAMLYAGDRLQAKEQLESALASGRTVLADRYVGSNLAHQGARVDPARRDDFLNWIRQLEYEVFGLPREDLVIYLRIPVEEARRRMALRARKLARDIQESDLRHLGQAAAVYDGLARAEGWSVIECFDAATGHPRPRDEIHREILAFWETRLGATARGAKRRPGAARRARGRKS